MISTKPSTSAFTDMLAAGYGWEEPSLILGAALESSQVHQEPKIRLPLSMANRHGLVAGATGTGKTIVAALDFDPFHGRGRFRVVDEPAPQLSLAAENNPSPHAVAFIALVF